MRLKKHTTLLDFRTEEADALIKVGKSADLTCKKRGRPSLDDAEQERAQLYPGRPSNKRAVAQSNDVRLDRYL